jgi:hypothetical protein
MAKLRKYPKQPKAKSGVAVWERYETRCKAVNAYNKALKEAPKKKEVIKARIAKLKG